jgi:hypothetical protein
MDIRDAHPRCRILEQRMGTFPHRRAHRKLACDETARVNVFETPGSIIY